MNLFQIKNALGGNEPSKNYPAVIALVGEELFQIEEALSIIKNYFVVTPEDRDFHYEVLDGEEVSQSRLKEACEMLPALLEPTRGVRAIVCRRWEKSGAEVQKYLEGYLADPLNTTCLILTLDKLDRRKGWAKLLEKVGWIIEADEPYDRDWPKWQGYLEKKQNRKMAPEAWSLLFELSGRKLSLVASEFEKISLYTDQPLIDVDAVWAVSASSLSADVFKFAEDVFAGRALEAMRRYRLLMNEGESEVKLLAILVRHYRQLKNCFEALQAGITDPKVLGPRLGIPPFFVPRILSVARHYRREKLESILQILAEADYSLKRGEGKLAELVLQPIISIHNDALL